jgi:hypothetical protein
MSSTVSTIKQILALNCFFEAAMKKQDIKKHFSKCNKGLVVFGYQSDILT